MYKKTQSGAEEIISKVETIRLIKMEISDLQRQVREDEYKMLQKIIDEGRIELLSLNRNALSRLSRSGR